jgi:hypothetical protein
MGLLKFNYVGYMVTVSAVTCSLLVCGRCYIAVVTIFFYNFIIFTVYNLIVNKFIQIYILSNFYYSSHCINCTIDVKNQCNKIY